MNLLQAIVMAVVQGVTEFLPVSSSGHLAILKHIFGFNTDTGLLFDTMLHLGTLIAVCIIYRKDIVKLFFAFIELVVDVVFNIKTFFLTKSGKSDEGYRRLINNAYKKFVVLILVTTIPTGIIGILLSGIIERASESLLIPGVCLVITAIILLVSDSRENGRKKVKKTTYAEAGIIGVAQGIATLPGISRSGTTITACILLGFDRSFAVKYSFIASIPAILGANILELRHLSSAAISGSFIAYSLIGMVIAGVVGFICIKIMINFVNNKKLQYCAYYCAVIGIISIIAYFIKG